MSDADDILNKLKELKEKKNISVFLPSLQREVKFSPLTLKQQKDILAATPQGTGAILSFNKYFNKVIATNNEEDISVQNLNNFDRLSVIISYRLSSVGNIIKNSDGEDVDLNVVLEKFKSFDFIDLFQEKEVNDDDFTCFIKIPDLSYEIKLSELLSEKISDENTYQEIMSEMFIVEVIKYISKIKIGEKIIDYKNITFDKKIDIVESLPQTLAKKILELIQVFKDTENKLSSYNDKKIDTLNELFA